jgi:hypothetical protein
MADTCERTSRSQIILAESEGPTEALLRGVPAVTVVGAVDNLLLPAGAAAQPVSKTATAISRIRRMSGPVTAYTSLRVLSYDRCQPIPQDR